MMWKITQIISESFGSDLVIENKAYLLKRKKLQSPKWNHSLPEVGKYIPRTTHYCSWFHVWVIEAMIFLASAIERYLAHHVWVFSSQPLQHLLNHYPWVQLRCHLLRSLPLPQGESSVALLSYIFHGVLLLLCAEWPSGDKWGVQNGQLQSRWNARDWPPNIKEGQSSVEVKENTGRKNRNLTL